MTLISFLGPARAFLLALALVGTCPAWAQSTAGKIKTKTTGSPKAVRTAARGEVPGPAAPPAASPVASAPQVVLGAPSGAAEAPAGWLSDLGTARAQARATNRPIVAVFSGSDWCKPCIMYEKEVFSQPEFAAYAQGRLVLVHFDFPRQAKNQPSAAQVKLNEAAAAQLNHEGDFPLAVIVSPEGQVLAKTGYIAGGPAAFEAYLKKILPAL